MYIIYVSQKTLTVSGPTIRQSLGVPFPFVLLLTSLIFRHRFSDPKNLSQNPNKRKTEIMNDRNMWTLSMI